MDKLIPAVIALVVSGVVGWGVLSSVPQPAPQDLGALAGPDIPSPYLQWGNVRIWNGFDAMSATASTTCSIQAPAATSTLIFAAAKATTGLTGATIGEWGVGKTAFATTTGLGFAALGTGQWTVLASSTAYSAVAIDGVNVVPPNYWLNFKVGTNTPYLLDGECYAQFIELPAF